MKWLVFLFASAFSLICEESCVRSCREEKELNRCLSDCGCVEKEISLVVEAVDIAFVMQKIPLEYNDIVFSLTGCSLYCEEPCWNFENKADILQCLKECNCFELVGIVKTSEREKSQKLDLNEKNNMENEEAGRENIEGIINVLDNNIDMSRKYNITENEQDKIEKNDIENQEADIEKIGAIDNTKNEQQEDEIEKNEIKNDIESQETDLEKIGGIDNTENTSRNYNFTENELQKEEIEKIEAIDNTENISRNNNFTENEQQGENYIQYEQKEAEIEYNEQDSRLNISNKNYVVEEEEFKNQIDQGKSEEAESDINSPEYNFTQIFESLIKNLTLGIFDHDTEQAGITLNEDKNIKIDENDPEFDIERIEPFNNSTEDILSLNSSTEADLPSNYPTEAENPSENPTEFANEVINNDTNIEKNDKPYVAQIDQLFLDNTTTQDLFQMQLNNTRYNSTEDEDLKLEPNENISNNSHEIIENSDEKLLIENINKTQEIKSENLAEPPIEDISEEHTGKPDFISESLVEEVSEDYINKAQETSAEEVSEENTNKSLEASAKELLTEEEIQTSNLSLQANFSSENVTNAPHFYSENSIESNKENPKNSQFLYQDLANGTMLNYSNIESETIKIDNNTNEEMCDINECQENSMANENKTSLNANDTVIKESQASDIDDKSTSSRIDDRLPLYYEAQKLSELWGEAETYGDKSQEIAENKTSESESENSIENIIEPELETKNYYQAQLEEQIEKLTENTTKSEDENIKEAKENTNLSAINRTEDIQKDIPSQKVYENLNNLETTKAENKQQVSDNKLGETKTISNNQEINLISPDPEKLKNPETDLEAPNKEQNSEPFLEDKKADPNNKELTLTENLPNNPSSQTPKSETNLQNNSVNPSSTKVSIAPSNCMVQCSQMCKKQDSELKCLEDCLTTFCKTFEENSSWSSLLVIAGNGFSLMFVVYCIWKFIKRKVKYDDDDSMFTPRYYNIS
ncbi:unnamed protein product [Blepharisma stoltei]|uniref:Uncharacterized protein n=1 Tax=Blepharisma stoltei TaxID=1481888 RepID=A0AAU9IKY4_9CILI|nr:unnamed protein product [Blepharisma stoltei]